MRTPWIRPITVRRCKGCPKAVVARHAQWCDDCRVLRRRRPPKYVWTPELDEYLRAKYDPRIEGRCAEIAQHLSWPKWVVSHRAVVLGLTRYHVADRLWTVEETAFLNEWAGRRSTRWIASRLPGRSQTSVITKLKKQRISVRVTEGYTMSELCLCLGVGHRVIRRLVAEGRLKAAEKAGPDAAMWRFTDHSILRFLREHPTSFRLDRVDQTWFLGLVFASRDLRKAREAA